MDKNTLPLYPPGAVFCPDVTCASGYVEWVNGRDRKAPYEKYRCLSCGKTWVEPLEFPRSETDSADDDTQQVQAVTG